MLCGSTCLYISSICWQNQTGCICLQSKEEGVRSLRHDSTEDIKVEKGKSKGIGLDDNR